LEYISYNWQSGGNPNGGCNTGHTQQYCNGYYAGYSKLWGDWTQNQIRINNEQVQSSSINIKGNNNKVTVNQGQASNSRNSDGASNSYGSSYGSNAGGN